MSGGKSIGINRESEVSGGKLIWNNRESKVSGGKQYGIESLRWVEENQ